MLQITRPGIVWRIMCVVDLVPGIDSFNVYSGCYFEFVVIYDCVCEQTHKSHIAIYCSSSFCRCAWPNYHVNGNGDKAV